MFYIGFIVLINIAIYEAFGVKGSTNWDIYFLCNYNLLLISYFFEVSKKTEIEVYKNFCKLTMWFFSYDTLAQLTYINKKFEEYQDIHKESKQTLLIVLSGFLVFLIFKIRGKNN